MDTSAEIAETAGLKRKQVYDSLKRLLKKGYVDSVASGDDSFIVWTSSPAHRNLGDLENISEVLGLFRTRGPEHTAAGGLVITVPVEKGVYEKLKRTETRDLVKLVEDWFYSDLDIEFVLKDGKNRQLTCKFESDVWYEHIGSPTRRSIRHGGDHRRFVVIEGDDGMCDDVEDRTREEYTKEELLELVEILGDEYTVRVT